MRIGIDGACLSNRRGFGRFARHLVDALSRNPGPHQYCVFVDRPSRELLQLPGNFETRVVEVTHAPTQAASAGGRRCLRDMLAFSQTFARARLDLLYFPATYSYVPVWSVPRVVVTMHDTLPFTHPELVFPSRLGRLSWSLKEHAAVKRSQHVVTVSEASKRDLISHFQLSPAKISVIVEGTVAAFHPQPDGKASQRILNRYGIDWARRFFLYVGGLSPHKNLLRLLDAFGRLEDKTIRLVLVGDIKDVFHTHVPAIRDRISRLGLHDRVQLPGFVPDADLAQLYSRAYALVQPSLLEGFGLPAVEAMACGTPVLYSRAGSLPEVVAEAGLSFSPTSTSEITETLNHLIANPALRDHLANLALIRSRRFTWEKSAEQLRACFENTVEPSSFSASA